MEEVPGPPGGAEIGTTDAAIGFALALIARSFGPFDAVLSALLTIFHELGHTVSAWTFGYPGLPAFDLRYGGGVTTYQARSLALLAVAYLLLGGALYLLRENPRGRLLAGVTLVTYAILAHTDGHHLVFLAAGHGGELVLGGVFLYRGLSGAAVTHDAERPLYVAIASYVVLRGIQLAWGLIHDPRVRARYENAKGGGHWMDFSRIAEKHLGVPLEWVAGAFLLACLAMPVVVWLVARSRDDLRDWWSQTLRVS